MSGLADERIRNASTLPDVPRSTLDSVAVTALFADAGDELRVARGETPLEEGDP